MIKDPIYWGVIMGIVSMIGFGVKNVLSKTPIKEIGPLRTMFWGNIFLSILFLLICFGFGENVFQLRGIVISFGVGIIGYFGLLSFLKGLEIGKVGVVTSIANTASIITIVLGVIFLNEEIYLIRGISLFLIILGIIGISLNFKKIKKNEASLKKSILYSIVTSLLRGTFYFLYKYPIEEVGPYVSGFRTEFAIIIYSGIHLLIKKQKIFVHLSKKNLIILLFVGISGILGTLGFNLGIDKSPINIVNTLSRGSVLVSVILGYLILNEKLNFQQIISILIILLGIVLISLF